MSTSLWDVCVYVLRVAPWIALGSLMPAALGEGSVEEVRVKRIVIEGPGGKELGRWDFNGIVVDDGEYATQIRSSHVSISHPESRDQLLLGLRRMVITRGGRMLINSDWSGESVGMRMNMRPDGSGASLSLFSREGSAIELEIRGDAEQGVSRASLSLSDEGGLWLRVIDSQNEEASVDLGSLLIK